jgi:hypothetical protein
MPGARSDMEKRVRFEVNGLETAMENIKRLQGTGQLTIHFAQGKPNGLAEWKSRGKS